MKQNEGQRGEHWSCASRAGQSVRLTRHCRRSVPVTRHTRDTRDTRDMRDDDPPTPTTPTTPTIPTTPSTQATSRLRRTLHSLRSPFRSGSPFHIGSAKRTGSTKSSASDGELTPRADDAMRKKNKKPKQDAASGASGTSKSEDGSPNVEKRKKERTRSLVRRFGSIGRRRGGEAPAAAEAAPAPAAHSSPARAMEESSAVEPEPPRSADPDPVALDVAVVHPVATKPFTKSAWKKRSCELEMEKPVEEPSPESVLRRRIAFVSQASACLSDEDADGDGDGEGSRVGRVGSLEEAVALARVRLGTPTTPHSASPSPCGRDAAEDTEEETYADAMPPYGDLIGNEPGGGGAPASAAAHASGSGGDRREHLYKILVIGELGTGKTSIIKRYVHQFFSQHYRATIGVDFALKVLNWDANTIIRLQLWDIAGQERFGNMTRVYYKEAVGAFIVFDVTRVATFDAVVKWKNDLDSKVQLPDGSAIPCVLLANKCDQQKEGIVNTPAKMDEYCREKGFAGWYETSAKENINIEEAARSLVNKILLNDKLLQSNDMSDADKFALDHKIANGENSPDGNNKSCAC